MGELEKRCEDCDENVAQEDLFPAKMKTIYLVKLKFNVAHRHPFTTNGTKTWKIDDAEGKFSESQPAPEGWGLDKAFGLPEGKIKTMAWAMPDPDYEDRVTDDAESRFKRSGGYAFFDEDDTVVAVKGNSPIEPTDFDFVIYFGERHEFNFSDCTLWRNITWSKTLFNTSRYCWTTVKKGNGKYYGGKNYEDSVTKEVYGFQMVDGKMR